MSDEEGVYQSSLIERKVQIVVEGRSGHSWGVQLTVEVQVG